MGIFSKLFSSSSTVQDVTKSVMSGVDKVWYTDEEKAEGFITLLKSYEPFKLAQRYIALIITIPYVLTWVLVALMYAIGGFVSPEAIEGQLSYSQHITQSANALGELSHETFSVPVSLVLGFYFGGGALEGVINKFRGKKE